VRYFWLFACAMFVAAFNQPARAAEEVVFAPAPAWVQPVAIPAGKASEDDAATRALLEDSQVYFAPEGDYYYFQSAYQVLTTDGLDDLGLVTQSWDPLLDTLTIHAVEIIRDGKVINAMNEGEPFSVIRRERNLNYAMLDGRLTATKQLEDLRVGDIVRVSMTIFTKDPSLGDHAEFWDTLSHDGVIAQARYRYILPKGRDLRWRTTEGFPKVAVTQTALGSELLADGRDVRMPRAPLDAPERFNTLGEIEITSFKTWQELSALFAPYYVQAATLKPDSPLRAEAAKIREANKTKIDQASAALALVEQRIRYVALTMGQAGYQPAQSDLTWTRRFGDCKGKTTLLISLLTELGIQAEPAIVRTHDSDGMDGRFPRAGLFDHVIVKATIDGKAYWLDATRSGDTDIRRLSVPPYQWALPLRAAGAALEPLVMARATEPLSEIILDLDQTAGLDADAAVTRTEIYRGESAVAALRKLQTVSRADAERTLRENWGKELPWFDIKDVRIGYELAKDGSLTTVVTGKSASPWSDATSGRQRTVTLGDSSFKTSFDKREAGRTPADAPYALNFPFFTRSTIILRLPRKGEGFEMVGADVDETIANMALRRKSTLKDGVFTTTLDVETTALETPYKEGVEAETRFARLPTAKGMVVRAPRDYAATGAEMETLRKARPSDAQAFVLSAEHNLAIYRPTAALADAEQALKLDPEDSGALRNKAMALTGVGDVPGALAALEPMTKSTDNAPLGHILRSAILGQYERYDEALAEADKVVELAPTLASALSHRADLYREMGKDAQALADVDAALKLEPDDAELQQLRIAYALPKDGPYQPWREKVIAWLDRGIAADAADADLYVQRGDMLWGSQRYAAARKDYDMAIAIDPQASHYISRAAFLASRQEDAAARADYDKAVELEPSVASYQARAVYRTDTRDFAGARADIEAALKLDADNPTLVASLALIEIETGDAAAAFTRIDRLAAQDPASFELVQMKATVHESGKAYDLALADVASLAARKGNTPQQGRDIEQMRAELLSAKGDHAQAIAIFGGLITRKPGSAQLLNSRCWARATAKLELPQAKADCDAALALASPTDAAPYLDSLGLVYLQLGRDAEAVETYDKVLATDGRYPTSLFGRGLAKKRLGDEAGATRDMTAAAKLQPDIATEFLGYQLAH
jgi:tetratricopeptide (TPR) repeat protein